MIATICLGVGVITGVIVTISNAVSFQETRKDWLMTPFIWFTAAAVAHYIGW